MRIGRRWKCLCYLALGGLVLTSLTLAHAQGPQVGKPTILEFSRQLCPVCAKVEAALKEVQARYGDQIQVRILHIDTEERLFKEYRVSFVPTQVFLDASGTEVARNEGPISQEQLVHKLKGLQFIKD